MSKTSAILARLEGVRHTGPGRWAARCPAHEDRAPSLSIRETDEGHNYTDTAWFFRLATTCAAICFTRGRIGFLSPEGKKAAPTQGQAFFYFGDDAGRFADEFSRHGLVCHPERCHGDHLAELANGAEVGK